jgi:hypothetical protein
MAYVKIKLDNVEHCLTPENLCLLRDQITAQVDGISIFEAIKLATALKISVKQLMMFLSGMKK